MKSQENFSRIIHASSGMVLKVMIVLMTISLILGGVNLCYNLFLSIINPPYPGMLSIPEMYNVFKLVLIIAIGYELIKSLLIILQSESIPARTILSIALIAIANKVITLDLAQATPGTLYGLAALVICFSAGVFFMHKAEKAN
jgi:uncharacterized membrane protein (DUF373 family)